MHETVFLQSAVDWLQIEPGCTYLDATFGEGGHSREMISRGARVIAMDYDSHFFEAGRQNCAELIGDGRLRLLCANFAQLDQLPEVRAAEISGVIFDLGTNSDQLMDGSRGLSVYDDGPLDMRLDESLAVTAHDVLMALSERELADVFARLGGEREAKAIARAIVRERKKRGLEAFLTSGELVATIEKTKRERTRLHPATKVFQALRMVVNDERANFINGLQAAWQVLAPGGRLVAIAFHEGEDGLVKEFMKKQAADGTGEILTRHPVVPDEREAQNHRARSAKMRVIQKKGKQC